MRNRTELSVKHPRRRVLQLMGAAAFAGIALVAAPARAELALTVADPADSPSTALRDRDWQRQAEQIRRRHKEILRQMAVNAQRRRDRSGNGGD